MRLTTRHRDQWADSPTATESSGADDAARLWLGPVLQQIERLAGLEADWDSYGALPPTPVALTDASRFVTRIADQLGKLAGDDARPAAISPLPTGGIEIEWRQADELIAIDIGPEGRLGYLRKTGRGRDATYEEATDVVEDDLPPLIAEVLVPRSSLAPASESR